MNHNPTKKDLDIKTLEWMRDEMRRDAAWYKKSGLYNEAFCMGYDYFLVHLDAGIERLKRGEGFNPTSTLAGQ